MSAPSKARPCKRCRMPIVIANGPNGPIPLQIVRSVYELDDNGQATLAPREDTAAMRNGARLAVSHFETCPSASEFSRGKRAQ